MHIFNNKGGDEGLVWNRNVNAYFPVLLYVYDKKRNTHDWSIDKPLKADFERDMNCMIDRVSKYSLIFLFRISHNLGLLMHFLDPLELFLVFLSDLKTFLDLYVDNHFWFLKYSHVLFLIWPHLGSLLHFFGSFGAIFSLYGYFWGLESGSKTFLEHTNVDYQFLFGKCSPIFLFLIRPNLGPFSHFWALRVFLGGIWSGSIAIVFGPINVDFQL